MFVHCLGISQGGPLEDLEGITAGAHAMIRFCGGRVSYSLQETKEIGRILCPVMIPVRGGPWDCWTGLPGGAAGVLPDLAFFARGKYEGV